MDSWSLRNLRQDLSKFLEIIQDYQIGDFSTLYNFQGKMESLDSFEYSLNIIFHLNKRISGTIPENLNKYRISLDNTITLNENDFTINDNIDKYLFELNIDAFANKDDADGESYKSCWHLDKHKEDGEEPKYTHATYHFHFGGKHIEGIDTGALSIFSSPRLPHPPMDIFLGFHFIISNFYSTKEFYFVDELLQNYDYQQIIKRAQERLWTPYFKAFDSTNIHQDFTMNKLFPLYIQ